MKTPSILIVEDESIIALDIKAVLQSLGYKISGIANSGESALAILKKHPADLVLMDIKIKGSMNGIVTTQKINMLFKIPVIFLTAFADEETLKKIREVEIYGFIVKPANRQTVQGTIELALFKHRMDNRLRDREERLQHVNQVLRAIRKVHMLITKETDLNRLIQGTCDNLVETLSYHRACIALYDSENLFSTFAFTGPENETCSIRDALRGPGPGRHRGRPTPARAESHRFRKSFTAGRQHASHTKHGRPTATGAVQNAAGRAHSPYCARRSGNSCTSIGLGGTRR